MFEHIVAPQYLILVLTLDCNVDLVDILWIDITTTTDDSDMSELTSSGSSGSSPSKEALKRKLEELEKALSKHAKKKKGSEQLKMLASGREFAAARFIRRTIFAGLKYYNDRAVESKQISDRVFDHLNMKGNQERDEYRLGIDKLIKKTIEQRRNGAVQNLKKAYLGIAPT